MNVPVTPEISVLIVTYNNATTIDDCLEAASKQTFQLTEILVWDNASEDNTCELVRNHPHTRLNSSPINIGFAAAINRLADKANGKFLFILNPDCICPSETLQTLLDFSQNHDAAISPALVFPDGTIQPSARQVPDYKHMIFSRRSPLGHLGKFDSEKSGFLVPEKPTMVPIVPATALFIPKRLFDEVGGFDERFFLYCEDFDLCRRLNDRNIAIWYLPDLRIIHLLRASSRKAPIKSLYYHHLALYKYFTKYNSRRYIKNLVLVIVLAGGFIISAVITLMETRKIHD